MPDGEDEEGADGGGDEAASVEDLDAGGAEAAVEHAGQRGAGGAGDQGRAGVVAGAVRELVRKEAQEQPDDVPADESEDHGGRSPRASRALGSGARAPDARFS